MKMCETSRATIKVSKLFLIFAETLKADHQENVFHNICHMLEPTGNTYALHLSLIDEKGMSIMLKYLKNSINCWKRKVCVRQQSTGCSHSMEKQNISINIAHTMLYSTVVIS